jgi:IrrE N-terminal-like domain
MKLLKTWPQRAYDLCVHAGRFDALVPADVRRRGRRKDEMKRLGTISRLFYEHWGEKTRTAAARKALEVLIAGSSRAEIPVNVGAAARYLGIERLVYAALSDRDGSLAETSSGRYVATIRSTQSGVRRRFTLAHEVGHAIVLRSLGSKDLTRAGSRTASRPVTPDEKDEERLCDLLASELLMPRVRFLAVMEEIGVSAETIPQIAHRFEVSLQACARKVARCPSVPTIGCQRSNVATGVICDLHCLIVLPVDRHRPA